MFRSSAKQMSSMPAITLVSRATLLRHHCLSEFRVNYCHFWELSDRWSQFVHYRRVAHRQVKIKARCRIVGYTDSRPFGADVEFPSVWSAARLQGESEGRSTDLRKCIRPLGGE